MTTKIKTKRNGRPYTIEVDYVLVKEGDKLKAWDVKTDGVGLVENYRTQFNKIIDEGWLRRPDREDEEEAVRDVSTRRARPDWPPSGSLAYGSRRMSLHPPYREAAEAWLSEDPDPTTARRAARR